MRRCELCGYEYDEQSLACHVRCPLAAGCAVICCPNCGYRAVDTERTGVGAWLKRWQAGQTSGDRKAKAA